MAVRGGELPGLPSIPSLGPRWARTCLACRSRMQSQVCRGPGGRGPGLSLPWAVSKRPKDTWAWREDTVPSPTVLSLSLKPERLVCPLSFTHTLALPRAAHTLHFDLIAHLATATGCGHRHLSRHTHCTSAARAGLGGSTPSPSPPETWRGVKCTRCSGWL